MSKHLSVFIRSLITIMALVLCADMVSLAQNNIASGFNSNYNAALHEKLFVHTDKAFYVSGEILWFKVYNVEATLHIPLDASKIAYAEVLDKNNTPVLQAKIALNQGSGSGSLYLPVTMASGNYKLRAYTAWMKNFSPDTYFEKSITIVNPLVSPETTVARAADYDVQFFPEGGNLVSGIAGKVAFRVVGQDGKGVNFNGAVIDNHNDTVARFKPLKFGIGSFMLTPAAGSGYRAVIKVPGNNAVTKALPAVSPQGYTMQVSGQNTAQLTVTVHSNAAAGGMVYLFTHSGAAVVSDAAQGVPLNNGTAIFSIDKAKLGEGISHLTIFNSDKQPVCERLYFKRPVQKLFVDARADLREYTSRKKVTVNIAAKDESGKPQMADMSLSVYQTDALQTADPVNIVNYLWLTSDLKGNIEEPGYYFTNNTIEADEALDNLMLSQGWSRFVWNDILKPAQPAYKFLPEANGLLITGKLTNIKTGAVAADISAYMGIVGKRVQFYTSKSDSAGNILFNTRDLYGTGEAVFSTNTMTDSIYHIEIQNPFSENYSKYKLPGWQVNKSLAGDLLNHSTAMQVQNIFAGNATKQFYIPQVDSTNFYGKAEKSYKLDDYTRFTTMEEVLREYIREVGVSHEQKKFHVSVLTYDRGYLDNNPLVIYDGVPVFDMDKLMAIDPLKVNRLDAINQHYYIGPVQHDGILNLTSYKGDLVGYDIDPHALVMDLEGVQFKRQFFSPVYQTDDQLTSRKADLRSLLYWSPQVYTDGKGAQSISFYTSDQEGTYQGVLQGVTADGRATVSTFTFDVKR